MDDDKVNLLVFVGIKNAAVQWLTQAEVSHTNKKNFKTVPVHNRVTL